MSRRRRSRQRTSLAATWLLHIILAIIGFFYLLRLVHNQQATQANSHLSPEPVKAAVAP